MEERQLKDWAEIYQDIINQVPVNVENAIIEVKNELRHGTVAREFSLKNCVVKGSFSAIRVTFAESVSFVDTVFEDGIDLRGCSINGYMLAQNVEVRSYANFEGISVLGQAQFERCFFKTEANFATTSFGNFVSFEGSTFEAGASFISATFGGHLMLTNIPISSGKFDLTWAAVAGVLNVSDSVFEGNLSCDSAKIGGTVLISDTRFGANASLNLSHAAVAGDVVIQKCSFDHVSGNCLDLNSIAISGGCKIERINCQGGFSLFNGRVSRYLSIGTIDVKDATATKHETFFHGNFRISSLRLEGYFWCTGTVFDSKGHLGGGKVDPAAPPPTPSFTDVTIYGQTYIIACEFKDGTNFNRSDFRGVFGTDAVFARQVTFEGAHFRKGVRFLPGCSFAKGAEFYFAEFDQEANFGGAKVGSTLSFRYAQFRHSLLFELKGAERGTPDVVKFQDEVEKKVVVALRGCSYARLVLPDGSRGLKDFVERVPPDDRNSFIYLEQYLRKSGHRNQADYVRKHWNRVEGLTISKLRPRWWLNRLHKFTTGYGTAVSPLIAFALVVGLLGLFVGYVPRLHDDAAKIIQTICWTVATLTVALVIDSVRGKVWHE